MNRVRSGLLGTLGMLVLLTLFGWMGLTLFGPKDRAANPNSQDLDLAFERISDDQNAVVALERAATQMQLRGLDPRVFLDPKMFVQSEGDRLVGENRPAINALKQALRLRAVSPARNPELMTFAAFAEKAVPQNLALIGKLTELILVEAKVKLESRDSLGAFEDVLTAAHAGQILQRAGGTLIEYRVGAKMEQQALEQLRTMLPNLQFTSSQWRERLAELKNLRIPNGLNAGFKLEFRYTKLLLERYRTEAGGLATALAALGSPVPAWMQALPASFAFHPQQTLETAAQYTRQAIQDAQTCPAGESAKTTPGIAQNILPWTANALGQQALRLLLPAVTDATQARCELEVNRAVAQTQSALRSFQQSRSELPVRLEELGLVGLTELPQDPYAPGKTLQYDGRNKNLRSENGLLYQIGF